MHCGSCGRIVGLFFFEPLADNRSQLGENLPGFCDTLPVHDDDLGQDTGCTNLSVEAQENIKTKKPTVANTHET